MVIFEFAIGGDTIAGKIHSMIETICNERSKGNQVVYNTTKTKLLLKGINPDSYGPSSPDDPAVIAKLRDVAREMGVNI